MPEKFQLRLRSNCREEPSLTDVLKNVLVVLKKLAKVTEIPAMDLREIYFYNMEIWTMLAQKVFH